MGRRAARHNRDPGDGVTTFRDVAWRLSPARLRTWTAARHVYAFISLPLDMIAQAADDAVKARFPTECAPDALPYHGRDRGIRRGPLEGDTSYRARLLLWLQSWRGAGVGRAMLDQIAGYLTPHRTRIRVWTQGGLLYTREADGTFTIQRVAGFDWDATPSLWSRFWVIIDSVGGVPWSRDGTWGDGSIWGTPTNGTWGSTATIEDVQSIRNIVDDWKPAAARCESIIISFDAAAFDPLVPGALPDGTWGAVSKNVGGVQVPTRDDRAIYWQGAL